MELEKKLLGGDLRSVGAVEDIVKNVKNQTQFDRLFKIMSGSNRLLQMRSIDAVEKITLHYPEYLVPHKNKIIEWTNKQQNIEFKWHLALLLSRLELNTEELKATYKTLKSWALEKSESKIVRVNSIQALHELTDHYNLDKEELMDIFGKIKTERIPSLNARIKHLIVTP